MTIEELQDVCFSDAADAGWHDDDHKHDPKLLNAARLMLITSEIGEAMEADRKSMMDDKLTARLGLEVELADAVIRIFDLAGANNLNLAFEIGRLTGTSFAMSADGLTVSCARYLLIDDPWLAAAAADRKILNAAGLLVISREVTSALTVGHSAPHGRRMARATVMIFDLARANCLDLAGAIMEKLEFNRTRHDHSAKARSGKHGKAY